MALIKGAALLEFLHMDEVDVTSLCGRVGNSVINSYRLRGFLTCTTLLLADGAAMAIDLHRSAEGDKINPWENLSLCEF